MTLHGVSQSLLGSQKNMPVDGASYMVGRTDERYYEKAK
jgi:hypothetical protein